MGDGSVASCLQITAPVQTGFVGLISSCQNVSAFTPPLMTPKEKKYRKPRATASRLGLSFA